MLGIKPSTFYRWYDRFRSGGPEALEDKPSKPDRVWNRIPDDIRQRVVMMAFEQPELSPRCVMSLVGTSRRFASPMKYRRFRGQCHQASERRSARCGRQSSPIAAAPPGMAGLCFRILHGQRHKHADPPNAVGCLRECSTRCRQDRDAEKRYELASPHCVVLRSKTAAYHIVGGSNVARERQTIPLMSQMGQTLPNATSARCPFSSRSRPNCCTTASDVTGQNRKSTNYSIQSPGQ
jgi:Homeodomain-like domain